MNPNAKGAQNRFENRIERLDLSLFSQIESQTSDLDKQSLLCCQRAVRRLTDSYVYLEIGSHLGGSLQSHLLDDRCQHIFSIDKRPVSQPDARGHDYKYHRNSTARMLENLKRLSPTGMHKITCLDDDTSNVDPARICPKPQICFIDGEHTDRACVSDAEFCLAVMDQHGLLVFHDACVVYNGLAAFMDRLKTRQVQFHAYNLPESVFVIEINNLPIHKLPFVQELLIDNYVGYLRSLQSNDGYRRFANRAPFRLLRRLKTG